MSDSCRPRKLVPGLAAIWVIPRLSITSTMKSELAVPCRIGISAGMPCSMRGLGGTGPTGRGGPSGWPAVCALAASGAPTAAAPASPAPLSKPRRLSLEKLLVLDMDGSVCCQLEFEFGVGSLRPFGVLFQGARRARHSRHWSTRRGGQQDEVALLT